MCDTLVAVGPSDCKDDEDFNFASFCKGDIFSENMKYVVTLCY